MLSDLAQHLIRDRCATHSWPLPSYPLAVDMPSALFRKIRDEKLCKRIFTKNFLPAGFVRQKTAAVEPAKQTVRVKKTLSADDVEDDFGSDHDEVMPVSKKRTAAVKSGKAAEETMEDESDDMDSELAPVKKGVMGKRVRRG